MNAKYTEVYLSTIVPCFLGHPLYEAVNAVLVDLWRGFDV